MGMPMVMEIYSSIARYLHRRKYERISRRKRVRVVMRIGGRRRSAWKSVRAVPKLRIKWALYPKKYLMKMRNGYVNLMTSFASSSLFCNSRLPSSSDLLQPPVGISNFDVFDEKMLLEIYRSLSPQALARLSVFRYGGDLPLNANMGKTI